MSTVLLGFTSTAYPPNGTRTPSGGLISSYLHTAIASGNLDTIKANLNTAGIAYRVYVFDSAGNRLGYGEGTSVVGINTFTISPAVAITSGTQYRLGYQANGGVAIQRQTASVTWQDMTATYASGPVSSFSQTGTNSSGYVNLWAEESTPAPSISSVDSDNAVTQYQQNVVIGLTDFTETITDVTAGLETCEIVSQVVGTSVTVNMPGSLSGTQTITVSGATESDSQDVTFTQTYTIAAPAAANPGGGGTDSNSIWANQGWTAGDQDVYWSGPSLPTDWAWIAPYTGWADAPTDQDVNDYLQAPEGFEGAETLTFSRIYSDATVVAWDVELTVSNGVISVDGSRSRAQAMWLMMEKIRF